MTHSGEPHDRPNDRPQNVHNGHQPSDDGYPNRPEPSQAARRVTVPQAADILGTTTDAVRSRMRRRKLQREERADGTVYVLLEGGQDARETVKDSRNTGEPTVGNGPQNSRGRSAGGVPARSGLLPARPARPGAGGQPREPSPARRGPRAHSRVGSCRREARRLRDSLRECADRGPTTYPGATGTPTA